MTEAHEVTFEQAEACRKLHEVAQSYVDDMEAHGNSHYVMSTRDFNALRLAAEKVKELWNW